MRPGAPPIWLARHKPGCNTVSRVARSIARSTGAQATNPARPCGTGLWFGASFEASFNASLDGLNRGSDRFTSILYFHTVWLASQAGLSARHHNRSLGDAQRAR
jgi:hypothetical protein